MSLKITPRLVLEICAVLIALALGGTILSRLPTMHDMSIGGQPLFGDFVAFWSAGRAALDGHADQVHDRALIFQYHHIATPGARFVAPWNSPPTFLLPMSLFALLPYPVAAILFLVSTAALYFYAAGKVLPDARAFIFAATVPALVYHVGTIQVGFLIAGIVVLAFYYLDRRPVVAGAFVAMLAIKPHLAILWPLLLALSGRWRAFAAAAAGTIAFVLLAGFVFGFESYLRFFENLSASQGLISGQRITTPAYASLYANLLDMGASQAVASGAQIISALAGVAAACWLFWTTRVRSGSTPDGALGVQAAALGAATMLVSPYLFFYDSVLLAVGAVFLGKPRDGFELAAMMLAWFSGLSVFIGHFQPLPLCPLAAWMLMLVALRRAGSAAPLPAPALQP
ncbi:MAG: DUF2029 domain-containing protein [Hyphomonadaceae bacterium]|nr:DUF2029 domain-containing protein [Hyphomonadaceae bacterium]